MRNKDSATLISVVAGIVSVVVALVTVLQDIFPKLLDQAKTVGASQLLTVLAVFLGGLSIIFALLQLVVLLNKEKD